MFESLQKLVSEAEENGKSLAEIVIETEMMASNLPIANIRSRMEKRLEIMKESTQQGLDHSIKSISGISGGSAFTFWRWLKDGNKPVTGSILSRAMARALSVNEVNAGMGCIVATPTAGSAGILPATLAV